MKIMEAVYCLCGRPYDPNVFMIQCDACKDWFHGSCCNFQEYTAIEIEKYHCPRCMPLYGPSVYKPYLNWHRHDYWDPNAADKPVQTGTAAFIRELRSRHFLCEGDVVLHMRGQQLTEAVLSQQGFNNPIVVDNKDGLSMTIPPDNFSLYDVEQYVGGDTELDVIDVTRQSDIRMKLRDFVAYFNSLNRTRIFNVVSLEFSDTPMARLVEAPLIARKMDWVNTVWPRSYSIPAPQVQKYCLMSAKDSYTDFHIDFGGTSVWYHILRGEKIFYFIKPTMANLTLYQQWMTSSNQSETFFADQVDMCYKCTLRQGQTMLIPTGWIHAVFTPIDSLVFGGNFLHSMNIPMQLQVYDIERKIKTVEKFRFPYFETINWFAAQNLLEKLTELNLEEKKCPSSLLSGLKSLLSSLKQWNADKDYDLNSRSQIPETISSTKFLKDIAREVRHAERYLSSLNPPKPERESKRKRKRPINKDFIDYSLSPKSSQDFLLPMEPVPEITKPPVTSPIKLTLPKTAMYPYERLSASNMEAPSHSGSFWGNSGRQEQTTAVHRGGAVLKFKLGAKDVFSHNIDTFIHPEQYSLISQKPKSVYDFNDDNDREDFDGLTIDENPPKQSIKMKIPMCSNPVKTNKRCRNTSHGNVNSGLPKNGIESLLKASAFTHKIIGNSGRTSPSTEDAIEGMLSIGQSYLQPGNSSSRGSRNASSPPYDEENLTNVHQDEDYVYPSLDNSDDEEIHIFKPRGRSKIDESWNPKAKVGPLLPKMNRPAREGTKKQAVEKVLEAAAAKRASEVPEKAPKRQYKRKKIKPKPTSKPSTSGISNPLSGIAGPSTSSSGNTSRQRKGMKTVKQRLGKILKIHKMIY
ncbi:lysine-specific demethylase 7B isoform X2 [Agrilus planipennis]|uniref:Lysine-specific demethylase 7B isoform X2 n=1 Tax=Agrilus planipennis TaxID=224129 RepID=A0A1W4X104_AGRPL|nr:lysine-specific demethylase 7B isoform X2 [Agrilus planipennis]